MKKEIDKLAKLTNLLNVNDVADILLVVDGFKVAALIEVSIPPNTNKSQRLKKELQELREILKNLNLAYRIIINKIDTKTQLGKYSFIAKDAKTLKKLIQANQEKDAKTRKLKTGLLLGYPKSAVVAFANNNSISNSDIPKYILKRNYFKFLNFRLSKSWKEEIKYLELKANRIKKISFDMYKKVVSLKT